MRILLRSALFLLALVLSFAVGFGWRDIVAGRVPDLEGYRALVAPAAAPPKTPTEVFTGNYSYILANYVRQLPADQLKYAAMEGMFGALGDPHTNFLRPQDAAQLKLETKGDFVGIGARLGSDPLGARIGGVFKNAPAARAGLKAGDTIIAVDDKVTAGLDTDEIVNRIRGQEGTTVRIKVVRAGVKEPLSFAIKRAVVTVPTAEGRMLEGTSVGYLSVTQFAQPTPAQFDQALRELVSQRPAGLVIDLRNNPGGLLEAASELVGRFVESKVVVKMRMRGGNEQFVLSPSGRLAKVQVPVVVLVNEASASAAEIFAGVMQEYKRATLVGEHTYGKASVQNVFTLLDLSSAKVTVAKYYLPSGKDLSRKVDADGEYVSGGLKPDVEVVPEPTASVVFGELERDPQLKRAVELIKERTRTLPARQGGTR